VDHEAIFPCKQYKFTHSQIGMSYAMDRQNIARPDGWKHTVTVNPQPKLPGYAQNVRRERAPNFLLTDYAIVRLS